MPSATLEYYEKNAKAYSARTIDLDVREVRRRFTEGLTRGARVLDAGCGSGRDALAFSGQGFRVNAFDASEALARLASGHTGLSVRQLTYAEIPWVAEFDGVWACSSLVHLLPEDFAQALTNLTRALKPGGILYTSLKRGLGPYRDGANRYFNSFQETDVKALLSKAGLTMQTCWESKSAISQESGWLNFLAVKGPASLC